MFDLVQLVASIGSPIDVKMFEDEDTPINDTMGGTFDFTVDGKTYHAAVPHHGVQEMASELFPKYKQRVEAIEKMVGDAIKRKWSKDKGAKRDVELEGGGWTTTKKFLNRVTSDCPKLETEEDEKDYDEEVKNVMQLFKGRFIVFVGVKSSPIVTLTPQGARELGSQQDPSTPWDELSDKAKKRWTEEAEESNADPVIVSIAIPTACTLDFIPKGLQMGDTGIYCVPSECTCCT